MSVDGIWQLIIDSPMGKQETTLNLSNVDGVLTGTMVNEAGGMSTEIFEGRAEAADLQWKAKLSKMPVTLTFRTTVDEDLMSGTVKAGFLGSFRVSGEKR